MIDCKSLLIFEQGARLIDACQDKRWQANQGASFGRRQDRVSQDLSIDRECAGRGSIEEVFTPYKLIVAQGFFIGTIASKSSRELANDAKKTLYHL